MPTEWSIEPFDRLRHDRSRFDCGVPSLNEWLAMRVSQYEKRDLARTYVLTRSGDPEVLGYYCISTNSFSPEILPLEQAKGLPKIGVPALLIGRLAVSQSSQGQGLGELLLLNALSRAVMLSAKVGMRLVEVEAIDESAQKFYESYGFMSLIDRPQHLFIQLSAVRRLTLPPL